MTTCPYCKDIVSEFDAVHCPSCDVTHHPECWEANGEACSVFGCESRLEHALLGCPWCEEVYSGERRVCMICNSPLMTPRECLDFVEGHEWIPVPLSEDPNTWLAAGYLRNNGVIARIHKEAPLSMFGITRRLSLWVAKEHQEMAGQLLSELVERSTNCPQCGHILMADEPECSYCSEEKVNG